MDSADSATQVSYCYGVGDGPTPKRGKELAGQKGMMERWFLTILGILLVCSLGAFLLLFPTLSAFFVVVICTGLLLMFALGVHVGLGRGATDQRNGEN